MGVFEFFFVHGEFIVYLLLMSLFNLILRYIDDVLSINNPNFANWIPLLDYSKKKLDVKETTETPSSSSFLDIYLKFDTNGKLSTREDLNFAIPNFQHFDNKIPTALEYGVYFPQLEAWACSLYSYILQRHRLRGP